MPNSFHLDKKVITFGCRLNSYESEIIKQNISDIDNENLVVFNSCSVTKNAENKVIKAIKKLKKKDPKKYVIATGCAVQNNPNLFINMKEVDKVIGNIEKLNPISYNLDGPRVLVNDIMSVRETSNHLISGFHGKSRAFIEVQNGCDHRCTFCNIPSARGNSRSVPIGVIVDQLKILINNGYQEIVFTGVDATSYGSDLPGTPTLAQMIRRVLSILPSIKRVRLSSIDIAEIDCELFNLFAYEPRLMPHVHISLQSGDNMILKRMKRRHNREQVIEFCNKLSSINPDISFGADIIAGFPTESDEMFLNSKNLISEAHIHYLHVFPYSEREGTPASRMPQVPEKIRKERAEILRKEGKKELYNLFKNNLGKIVEILTEQNNMGHTRNFIPVKIKEQIKPGMLVNAKLTGIDGENMIANIIY